MKTWILALVLALTIACGGAFANVLLPEGEPIPFSSSEVYTVTGQLRINLVAPGETPCEFLSPGHVLGCFTGEIWATGYRDPTTGKLVVKDYVLGHELIHWLDWQTDLSVFVNPDTGE